MNVTTFEDLVGFGIYEGLVEDHSIHSFSVLEIVSLFKMTTWTWLEVVAPCRCGKLRKVIQRMT